MRSRAEESARTTEAPALQPNHAFRRNFARYGVWAASHVKIGLPLVVGFAFILIYPILFLYTTDDKAIYNGASSLPHHVWTNAQPLDDKAAAEPDVIMRSIWVHGSYMKALEREVLLGTLELQDKLLGPTRHFNPRLHNDEASEQTPSRWPADMLSQATRDSFHIVNGLTQQSWFFHSPLQYWSGCADRIEADQDIVETVNMRKTQSTSVNVTLRHSIVFSGKRFEDGRLLSADALVVTLIHRRDSPVGRQWAERAEALANAGSDKWHVIPPDGKIISSLLYEFQFRPISWTDWLSLTLAYLLTLIYVTKTLSHLPAIKSKAGLVLACLVQIAASVASSFTVCAVFKVDVSRVPYYAFPLVILAISLENSLRLIEAVIINSSTVNINHRIGEALGETAHIVVFNRVGNLLLLLVLSLVTYPGVAAWCTFAAIATVFDFLYFSSFFLLVLKLDLRSRELSEMDKASQKRVKVNTARPPSRRYNQVLRAICAETLTPTRIAGTIVLLAFVIVANHHAGPNIGFQLRKIAQMLMGVRNAHSAGSKSSLLTSIHQARSPTSWLRLQDHETAREVIQVVKPWAHSYIARVYDPLVFVLRGSNRTPDTREPLFLPALYDFMHHQIPGFMTWLALITAFMFAITRYLVRDEVAATDNPDHPDDEPLLSVKVLSGGHTLDVFHIEASSKCKLASVGLDRTIQLWNVRSGSKSLVVTETGPSAQTPFPVLAMAIDPESRYLAVLSSDRVLFWNIRDQRWATKMVVDLGSQRPAAFLLATSTSGSAYSAVAVKQDGRLLEIQPSMGKVKEHAVCQTPLIWAVPLGDKKKVLTDPKTPSHMSILTASRKGCTHLVTQHNDQWHSEEIKLSDSGEMDIHCLVPISGISMYLVGRRHSVDLVDIRSSTVAHTFRTEPVKPRSLKHLSSSRGAQSGISSLTLAYVNAKTGELVLQTYLPTDELSTICTCRPSSVEEGQPRTCCPWDNTREVIRHLPNPGSWEALSSGCVVGVRKISPTQQKYDCHTHLSTPGLLHRRAARSSSQASRERWEIWAVNQLDRDQENYETRPLQKDDEIGSHLLVSELGPMVKLGTGSVAVGFGSEIKIISVGLEHFDASPDRLTAHNLLSLTGSRKRRGAAPLRSADLTWPMKSA